MSSGELIAALPARGAGVRCGRRLRHGGKRAGKPERDKRTGAAWLLETSGGSGAGRVRRAI